MKIKLLLLNMVLAVIFVLGSVSLANAWICGVDTYDYRGSSELIGTDTEVTYWSKVAVMTNEEEDDSTLNVHLYYSSFWEGEYQYSTDTGSTWQSIPKTPDRIFSLTDLDTGDTVWMRVVLIRNSTIFHILSPSPWGEADDALGDLYYFAFPPGSQYYNRGTTDVKINGFVAVVNDSPEIHIPTVESAGQTWMDRNLGAARVAISSTDEAA